MFIEESDYRYYLDNLVEWKAALGCKVYGYCLMTSHVHLIIDPGNTADSLGLLIKRLAGRQTRLVNKVERRTGSLWEGRFKSSVIQKVNLSLLPFTFNYFKYGCEMKKAITETGIGVVLFMASVTANAGVSCAGNVTTLGIGPTNSTLQVNAGYGVHFLCKIDQVLNGISPETCKALYSMFLTAKTTGRQVIQYYDNGTVCADLGSWVVPSPVPYFIDLGD